MVKFMFKATQIDVFIKIIQKLVDLQNVRNMFITHNLTDVAEVSWDLIDKEERRL